MNKKRHIYISLISFPLCLTIGLSTGFISINQVFSMDEIELEYSSQKADEDNTSSADQLTLTDENSQIINGETENPAEMNLTEYEINGLSAEEYSNLIQPVSSDHPESDQENINDEDTADNIYFQQIPDAQNGLAGLSDNVDFEIENGILTKYNGNDSVVYIPESVTEIGPYAFLENQQIKEVIIPQTVKKIEYFAFAGSSLSKLSIPSSVESIGAYSFKETNLTSLIIPDSVKEIQINAFENIKSLKEVKIGSGLNLIPPSAFLNCTSLNSVELGKNVRWIYERSFSNTAITSIDFPDSLEEIAGAAFESTKLTKLTISGNMKYLGYNVFRDNNTVI